MANPIIINDSSCEIIYLKKKDKRLAKIINTVGPIVCSTHDGNEYAFFVHEIIEQMLSIKAGKKIYDRLESLCGGCICKRKNAAISKRLQRFLKSIFNFAGLFYLSSFSTSEISFAVAVTIRMPLSLISSRRASSCRRFVFFSAGVSKRNWSTDIL